MKKYDVMVVGDVNIDLIVEGCDSVPEPGREIRVKNIATNVGGGAALCAMGLSKLGLKTGFYGLFGNDIYSSFILNKFNECNIETYRGDVDENNHTGISIAIFGENDRAFITYDGPNSEFDVSNIDMDIAKLAGHIHVTGYKGRKNHDRYVEFVRKLKEHGLTVSTDVGWDDTGEWYEGIYEFISLVDIFFINEVEAVNYTHSSDLNTAINKLSKFCRVVALKLGSNGSAAKSGSETAFEPAYEVEVVDTTGAGDSFNAGFIYGYLNGFKLDKCLRYGNACGALSTTKSGGNTGFPDILELERFMAENKRKICVGI